MPRQPGEARSARPDREPADPAGRRRSTTSSERPLLPSFLYLPAAKEFPPGALDLPWKSPPDRVVGVFAREHGAKVPGRLVSSAKSWLSHAGRRPPRGHPALDGGRGCRQGLAGRRLGGLPRAPARRLERADRRQDGRRPAREPGRLPDRPRLVRRRRPRADHRGRRRRPGSKHVTLLEEPQAAFYAWLAAQGDEWRKKVKVGDIILVCDVGGGTTDFTLIAVTDEGGDLALSRLAVGEHILLGGDNMDLALAYAVAATLPQGMEGLDAGQRVALGHACRTAKETLFTDLKKNAAPVDRPGPRLQGHRRLDQDRADPRDCSRTVLLDGFLPRCAPTDLPTRGRRVGLTEIGLPYAADPAITRHLARFLGQQAGSLHTGGATILPSAVLFNGGVFKAAELRRRVLEVLSRLGRPAGPRAGVVRPRPGRGPRGRLLRPGPARARACGSAAAWRRSYYVGLETAAPAVPGVAPPIKALCVVPMGMEEGTEADVPGPEIGLVVGEPAEFRFLGSTTRRDDPVGTMLERWNPEELQELAPLETALAADDGELGRGRAGPAALARHRGRHARALVPEHPRRPALEAGIQRAASRPRIDDMSDEESILTSRRAGRAAPATDLRRPGRLARARPRSATSRGSIPQRQGDGVTLDAILERAGVLPEANYLTLHADRDDFHVSVPLEPVRGQGIVVYRLGDGRLGLEHGGPIRFLIRDPAACHTDELDECANVKYLSRIELTTRAAATPARPTRPSTRALHA